MRFIMVLAACVLLVNFGERASGAPAPSSRPTVPETYVLGPGDSIEITVYGESDLSHTVTIKPDGTIALALINEVKAAGKTTAQLENELAKMYSKYLKTPSVSVVVSAFRVDHIYLLGQVGKPGDYPLKENVGIFELLSQAGGPTSRADLAKAVIIRGKTETIKVDLLNAIAKNQPPNVKLLAGDVLFIPETDRRIVALGEVGRPGAYDLLEGQRISELLAAAGGPTKKAGLTKAFIMRDGAQVPVDLKRVLAGDAEANMALKPGDMVVVPENKDKIAILGSVAAPGPYDLSENMNLIDALALAGGPTEKANLAQMQVVRYENGKATVIKVKADQAIQGKDASQNIKLQTGDVLYVPVKGPGFLDILGILGGIRGILGF
jgi:polysaccharide biosynthesis/export protein